MQTRSLIQKGRRALNVGVVLDGARTDFATVGCATIGVPCLSCHLYCALLCKRGLAGQNFLYPFVCLFVGLSVSRMHCDKTKEPTADVLIPHERIVPLIFCYKQRCWSRNSVSPKLLSQSYPSHSIK